MQTNQIEPVIEQVIEATKKIVELTAEDNIIQTLSTFMMIGYLLTISLGLIKGWLEDKYDFGSFKTIEKTKDHLDEIDNFNNLDKIENFDNLNEIEEEYLIELKCKNCKGHLEIKNNYFQCKYCDTKYIRKK